MDELMKIAVILALGSIASIAQATLIDGFTVPYTRTLSSGSYVDFQQDPSLFVGERDVQMDILSNSSGGQAHLEVGNGRFSLTNDAGVGSYVRFQYDLLGDEVGNTGPGRSLNYSTNPVNPFPPGADRVLFHLESVNAVIGLGVELYSGGVLQFQSGENPPIMGNQVVTVQLHHTNFEQCDSIVVSMYLPNADSDVVLTKVELVPEPGTGLSLVALSFLFGLQKKRRSGTSTCRIGLQRRAQ